MLGTLGAALTAPTNIVSPKATVNNYEIECNAQ